MKKFLLFSCAFAACVGASAQQHLQKAPFANEAAQLSKLTATQFTGKVAAKAPQKVSTDKFIGLFINNAWEEAQEINTSTVDTMFTANVTADDGTQLNVKWGIYSNLVGGVYAHFDEKTNTFTVPKMQYLGDGKPVELGDQSSPIFFSGVSVNNYYCDYVCQYDPATNLLTPNDTIAGYYAIVAEGDYQGQWVFRNVSPMIARANAIQEGFVSGEGDWEELSWPVYVDYTTLEDGVVDVYNHYLNGRSGCKISVDIDGGTATMAAGQPMIYISDEQARADYGDYVLLRGVAIGDDNSIRPDFSMATIEGGAFDEATQTIDFKGVYWRGFSEIKNDRGWGTPFFAHNAFRKITDGISSVTTNAEKATDNRIFNLAGQQVDKNYKGVVIQNGVKKLQK